MGIMDGSTLSVRFPPEMVEEIDRIRRTANPIPSISDVVRQLAQVGLDERKRRANKREFAAS